MSTLKNILILLAFLCLFVAASSMDRHEAFLAGQLTHGREPAVACPEDDQKTGKAVPPETPIGQSLASSPRIGRRASCLPM